MAEFTNPNIVTVSAGENLPLTETAVKGPACIVHREGAGIVTLRGLTNQCKARFKVSFGGNCGAYRRHSRGYLCSAGNRWRAAEQRNGHCYPGGSRELL